MRQLSVHICPFVFFLFSHLTRNMCLNVPLVSFNPLLSILSREIFTDHYKNEIKELFKTPLRLHRFVKNIICVLIKVKKKQKKTKDMGYQLLVYLIIYLMFND